MFQQSSKHLVKMYAKALEGKPCPRYFEYLNEAKVLTSTKNPWQRTETFGTLQSVLRALQTRAAFYTMTTCAKMTASQAKKKVQENELFAMKVNQMAKAHSNLLIFAVV